MFALRRAGLLFLVAVVAAASVCSHIDYCSATEFLLMIMREKKESQPPQLLHITNVAYNIYSLFAYGTRMLGLEHAQGIREWWEGEGVSQGVE